MEVILVVGRRGPGLRETLAGVRERATPLVVGLSEVLASRSDGDVLADQHVVAADTEEELLAHLDTLARRHEVAGVLTVADDAVLLTARIADRLGLRGHDLTSVVGFRDKAVQRARLAAAGLTVPRWQDFTAARVHEVADFPFPALLKPTRGSGGVLVFVVDSFAELLRVVEESAARAAGATAVDGESAFVLEEILVGVPVHPVAGLAPYVSVETASVDGRRHHFAVTDRFPLLPPVLETGMSLPSCLGEQDRDQVLSVVDSALRALGLWEGMSHTEVMLTADGPVIIEVNARLGGALPYLYPLAGGSDLFAAAVDCATGVVPVLAEPDRQAVCVNLQHPLGVTVEQMDDLTPLSALTGVVHVLQLSGEGHSTESLQDTLAGLVLAQVAGPEDAVRLWDRCQAGFTATYATGRRPDHYRRTPDGTLHA